MSSTSLFKMIVTALMLATSSLPLSAQSSDMLSVSAFSGEAGYQEIQLSQGNWYLAFHGTRKHSLCIVEAGWLARAGQLCESDSKQYVVELRYVDEPVYETDQVAAASVGTYLKMAGVVYIPMFIPSGPRNIPANLTPTKAAAIRCVDDVSGLRPGKTGISVADARDSARKLGVSNRLR